MNSLQINFQDLNNYLLLLLGFFISISIYVTDLIILLFCVSWLLSGNLGVKVKSILTNPITCSAICFFIYFLFSHLWSHENIFNTLAQKQSLLLLLPILYTLNFENKYIENTKYTFLIGLFINILFSIMQYFTPLKYLVKTGHYDDEIFARGFLDHFDYAVFLCFGIFLIFSLMIKHKKYISYLLLVIIFFIALINSYGRIGIVSFLIFFPFFLYTVEKSKYIYFIISIVTLLFITVGSFSSSPFNNRIQNTIRSIELLQDPPSLEEKIELDAIYLAKKDSTQLGKEYFKNQILKDKLWIESIENKKPQYETSLGQRYIFIKNSIQLISERPVFGFGANKFQIVYNRRFPNKSDDITTHPHNNFIFIMIELGIVGVIFLLSIFYFHLKKFWLSKEKSFITFLLPTFFLFIMLFDNYFLNHNTLALFCLFSFIFYSNKIDNLSAHKSS
jgi:O-antigen ligase